MKSKILTSVSLSPEVGCPPNFWTNSRWNHLVFEGCPPHSDCNCGTGGCEGIEDSGRFHLQYLGPRWLKHREIDVLCLEKIIFILSWVIKHPGGSCSPSHQPPEDYCQHIRVKDRQCELLLDDILCFNWKLVTLILQVLLIQDFLLIWWAQDWSK